MAKHSSGLSNFRRYPSEGYVAGVCSGIAHYLDWNVRLIRALAVLTLIFGGGFPILLVYAVLWYVMEPDSGRLPPPDRERASPYSDRYGDAPRSSRYTGTPPSASELRERFTRLEQRLNNMEECVTSNDYELRRELRKLGA